MGGSFTASTLGGESYQSSCPTIPGSGRSRGESSFVSPFKRKTASLSLSRSSSSSLSQPSSTQSSIFLI